MRKQLGAKPLVYPEPVFIIGTYDESGKPNAMNAAWGSVNNDYEVFVCLSPEHKTCKNFEKTGAFTVNIADAQNVIAADYVGIVSGNKVEDKFEKAGFTETKSAYVNAPIINELPLALECEVKVWQPEECRLVGVIKNVSADERILDGKGKIDIKKLNPITYDPEGHGYYTIGERVGSAFGDGMKIAKGK